MHVFLLFQWNQGLQAYKLYDLYSKEVFVSRYVIFYEQTFPILQTVAKSSSNQRPNLVLPTEQAAGIEGEHPTIINCQDHFEELNTRDQSNPKPIRKSSNKGILLHI